MTLFPVLRDWISEFLHENKDMTASQIGHNMLIEQVLRLFHFLVKFGYYGNEDIKQLLKPLLNLLNGKNDKPFQPDTEKGNHTVIASPTFIIYHTSRKDLRFTIPSCCEVSALGERDPPWSSGYDAWLPSVYSQVRVFAGSPSCLAWSLYTCAALWTTAYGPSATERPLGTIREE